MIVTLMRIVSLVPSWTETLVEAGVNVVGRTRYCIHPQSQARSISVVGGTKDIQWQKVRELEPDLLLFDREENPKKFADESPFPYLATHVTDVVSVAKETQTLSAQLSNDRLKEMAERWNKFATLKLKPALRETPGIIEWWREPQAPIQQILYVILRNPFMAVSTDTFIGSMLKVLGLGDYVKANAKKYFEFDAANFDQNSTLLLFSTEPYPFARERAEVEALGFPCALVDGEKLSWFGIRTLRFLEASAFLSGFR